MYKGVQSMSMDKKVNIPLETTAQYQSMSNLGVQFWRQDTNTAKLQFQITKNNYPLALSEENVKVFIALESGDSFLVDDKLEFVDQLNGVVSYTIPDDFMKVATEVKGQVYVTTLDEEEVVVQRQFTFNVANDLIATLPASDKIREIKYFSDMRAEVAEMMTKLNSDFENMNDYVTQVQDTTKEGIEALNRLIDEKEKAYNANHEAKMKELNDKGDAYSTKFDEDKQYMDEKFEAFKSSVNGSGLITTGASKDWQKYKLTNDDGTRQYLKKGTIKDITTLAPGSYETVSDDNAAAQGFPTDLNNTYVQIDISTANGDTTRKRIELTSSYNGELYYRIFHTSGTRDTGWKKVAFNDPSSPFETTTGSQAKAKTAENNAKQYTDSKVASTNVVLFEGTANGVGANLQLNDSLDNYIVLYVYISFPGGTVPVLASPFGTNAMPIQVNNVVDTDGNGGGQYECILTKTSRTLLKITNDVYYDTGTQTGSGANANKITINKIIGVHK